MSKTWLDYRLIEMSLLIFGKIDREEYTEKEMEIVRELIYTSLSIRLTLFMNNKESKRERSQANESN